MPGDRQFSQGLGKRAALSDRQVQRMATLDQRTRQIRHVALPSSHLLSRTDLQNLHMSDPKKWLTKNPLYPTLTEKATDRIGEQGQKKEGGGWTDQHL